MINKEKTQADDARNNFTVNSMPNDLMTQLEHTRAVLIIHHYTKEELDEHCFGGARLIWEQKKFFVRMGYKKVKLVSLRDADSFTSKILDWTSKIRRDKDRLARMHGKSEKRALLNLLFAIFSYVIYKIDFLWRKKLEMLIKTIKPDLILCNYPTYADVVTNISNNLNIACILYKHNVEYLLFDQLLGSKRKYKLLIWLMKHIELMAIEKVKKVICVSTEDKEKLIKWGVPSKKIFVWVPCETIFDKSKIKTPLQLESQLKDKFVIGFVGAYFEPNIISVENIIRIAQNLESKNVVFLILGKVCDAFKNRNDIPSNIILKGFVRDLDSYLSLCDAFINPKTVCDTGIEIKMFDYLKFNKPIISTEIGARGFKGFKNIIIASTEQFSNKINALLDEKQKL